MKFNFILILLFFCAFAKAMTAQDFQGIATYESMTQVDLKMENSKMSDETKKSLAAQLQKQMNKTFTLLFDQNQSLYTENQKLAQPTAKPTSGITITVHQSQAELYKNLREKRYVNQDELFGKVFLIQDSLQLPAWQMEKETKKIGQYTCYKATMVKKYTREDWSSASDSLIKTEDEKTITAWYTPQIPVSNGPRDYWGLPGLILEVQDGKTTLLCSAITLNPSEKMDIKEPNKGKSVDQAEFDTIQNERMEEMRARSDNGKGLFITKSGG